MTRHPSLFAARRRPVHADLARAVRRATGPGSEILSACERAWASASFVGARHQLVLALPTGLARGDAVRLAAALGDREWTVRGTIVADLAADVLEDSDGRCRLNVEALTVEDA